ncbi:sensor histidine kinase [Jidongwangia harbinensis]|uniref:sensor histidine kinase n=1 Tax=Jidongwangia harbinensis TaxID=2878561 RepID=UPI001CD9A01E|nr:HAMP domain-containing sensor histidine kinase [Jidongwangia harbinensis]MCA2217245.1 HAMP domain-containing histidine kinase [Jidongwangia harbinensis]
MSPRMLRARMIRSWMARPPILRSIRFRLTVLYSLLLFALAAATLAITYFAVAQSTDPQPITAQRAKIYENYRPVGFTTVAEISQIEAAVNYNTLQNLRNYSLMALGGLFVASLGIGWVLSGRALRPVGAIARTARDIQATDLSRRINLDGPHDELRDLADTIDSMLERLDHAFQSQRQLIDDASHELRSPLAIIRTNLDASLTAPDASPEERTRAVAVVDRATTRMSRLVEDLLATARRDSDAVPDADVYLATVAREAGEEYGSERVSFAYDVDEGLRLIGDHDALRRAVGNLLSNAVRLAPSASTVTIAGGRTGSWLWLVVADQGPGIAPDHLSRVFDRFWRAPGNAPVRSRERRTGLGLAIVRQIVESHGGQVAAHSTLGVGSTFVLWLPAPDRTDDVPPPDTNPWPR